MGKLHNPGPGEIADRLTILALKMAARPGAEPFRLEWAALLPTTTLSWDGIQLIVQLAGINGILWQKEDELRTLRTATQPLDALDQVARLATLAIQIQELNDRRNDLIHRINGNDTHSEKVW